MAIAQVLLLFIFPAFSYSSLFALSETTTISENDSILELQQIKLKIAHLGVDSFSLIWISTHIYLFSVSVANYYVYLKKKNNNKGFYCHFKRRKIFFNYNLTTKINQTI